MNDLDGRCNAKRRDGDLCQKFPIKNMTRCRLHGGKSLQGVGHPNWKTGRYSSLLPERMKKQYDDNIRDEADLLSVQCEIRLTDVLLAELTKTLVDNGDNDETWLKLLQTIEVRRKLAEGEVKSLFVSGQMVSKADVRMFILNLSSVIKHVVEGNTSPEVSQVILVQISKAIVQTDNAIEAAP